MHAAAWKRLFDEFLKRRSADTGEPFVPFDIDVDYRRHVDGKPRYAGVAANERRNTRMSLTVHVGEERPCAVIRSLEPRARRLS